MTVDLISPSGSVKKKLTYIFLFYSYLSVDILLCHFVGSLSYKTVYGRNKNGRSISSFDLDFYCAVSVRCPSKGIYTAQENVGL